MSAPAQGWYRDPDDPTRHRWWTGEGWRTQEEHFADVRRRRCGTACGEPPETDLD